MICDIGGMMGVYAGFSMVTFLQLIWYGGNIPLTKWRKKRTAIVTPNITKADPAKGVHVGTQAIRRVIISKN